MANPFDVTNFTDGMVGGEGTFDKMMVAARAHLILEHDAGRITGDKFAEVYLGTMQSVLQTANQFTLMETKIEHENENLIRQGDLIAEQTKLVSEQIDILQKQKGFGTMR